jgi:hypothetical protein
MTVSRRANAKHRTDPEADQALMANAGGRIHADFAVPIDACEAERIDRIACYNR